MTDRESATPVAKAKYFRTLREHRFTFRNCAKPMNLQGCSRGFEWRAFAYETAQACKQGRHARQCVLIHSRLTVVRNPATQGICGSLDLHAIVLNNAPIWKTPSRFIQESPPTPASNIKRNSGRRVLPPPSTAPDPYRQRPRSGRHPCCGAAGHRAKLLIAISRPTQYP